MRKVKVFIAQSLDGYIATTDERLDWLESVEGEDDNGYSDFLETVDTVVFGSATYDWLVQNVEQYPYQSFDSYIITSKQYRPVKGITFTADPEQLITSLVRQPGEDIWVVGGGQLVSALFQAGLIDELILTVAPVLLGAGIPLWREVEAQLQLQQVKQYGQFVAMHYLVEK